MAMCFSIRDGGATRPRVVAFSRENARAPLPQFCESNTDVVLWFTCGFVSCLHLFIQKKKNKITGDVSYRFLSCKEKKCKVERTGRGRRRVNIEKRVFFFLPLEKEKTQLFQPH